MDDLIGPEAVRARQAAGAPLLLVDVRSAAEYAASHLPGARHVALDELEHRLGELPADTPVVTYCTMRHRGDSRGERAAALLREHGYRAQALDGGLPAWEAAGLPVQGDRERA